MPDPTLFDPELVAAETPPPSRVRFLAGMLSEWTFSPAKATTAEREAMTAIAIDALERATAYRRT